MKNEEFLPQTLISNHFIFTTRCHMPLIFQTIKSVRSNSQNMEHQRFTPSGCKIIGIRPF